MQKLQREFFKRDTLQVAKDLLGKKLVFDGKECIITETEAYIGTEDEACHAACGKTKRNAVMFGDAGFSYVYLIYGMYHCLNFITEEAGKPCAVLIRGAELTDSDSNLKSQVKLDGPAKLCRYLGITKNDSEIDITTSAKFYIYNTNSSPQYSATPRIGIKKATDKLRRFVKK